MHIIDCTKLAGERSAKVLTIKAKSSKKRRGSFLEAESHGMSDRENNRQS